MAKMKDNKGTPSKDTGSKNNNSDNDVDYKNNNSDNDVDYKNNNSVNDVDYSSSSTVETPKPSIATPSIPNEIPER